MLLVTALPLPNGYRIVAATTYHTPGYQWSLERNQRPVGRPQWSQWPLNAVCFEVLAPLASGIYQVRLCCWDGVGEHPPLYPPATAIALVVVTEND